MGRKLAVARVLRMTKKHDAELYRRKETYYTLQQAVYAVAHPRVDVPLSDCLAMATPGLRDQYNAAAEAIGAYERQMVAEGRAYFGEYGRWIAY